MFENSLKYPQSIYYVLITVLGAWKRIRRNPQGASSLLGVAESWEPRGGMPNTHVVYMVKDDDAQVKCQLNFKSKQELARLKGDNYNLWKYTGPRNAAWRPQLQVVWNGGSTGIEGGKGQGRRLMRRVEGSWGAEAARPGGWDLPHSPALGPCRELLSNPSCVHPRKMTLRAEMEGWVSVCKAVK